MHTPFATVHTSPQWLCFIALVGLCLFFFIVVVVFFCFAFLRAQAESTELLVLGAVWRNLDPAEQSRLLPRARILARASPQDKLDVVNLFVTSGLIVSMCGDGGNDCGALKVINTLKIPLT